MSNVGPIFGRPNTISWELLLFYLIQWNLDLRKPDLRKNLDLRKIVGTTNFLVHKLFDLPYHLVPRAI